VQISTRNGEMKILVSQFHRETNMMALLLINFGSRNKTLYILRISKCGNLKGLTIHSLKIESPFRSLMQYEGSLHAFDLRFRFFKRSSPF
jgi:hypothetical protein